MGNGTPGRGGVVARGFELSRQKARLQRVAHTRDNARGVLLRADLRARHQLGGTIGLLALRKVKEGELPGAQRVLGEVGHERADALARKRLELRCVHVRRGAERVGLNVARRLLEHPVGVQRLARGGHDKVVRRRVREGAGGAVVHQVLQRHALGCERGELLLIELRLPETQRPGPGSCVRVWRTGPTAGVRSNQKSDRIRSTRSRAYRPRRFAGLQLLGRLRVEQRDDDAQCALRLERDLGAEAQ
jgi:hypothetical protein